jgi:hypothetical protein
LRGEVVKVRARLSDRETDVVVNIGCEESVGVLVRRIREVAGVSGSNTFGELGWEVVNGSQISPHTRLKIAYMGKILHDHEPLAAQGWREKDVVNALVFQ